LRISAARSSICSGVGSAEFLLLMPMQFENRERYGSPYSAAIMLHVVLASPNIFATCRCVMSGFIHASANSLRGGRLIFRKRFAAATVINHLNANNMSEQQINLARPSVWVFCIFRESADARLNVIGYFFARIDPDFDRERFVLDCPNVLATAHLLPLYW